MVLWMKKFLGIVVLGLLLINNANADSIVEELTKLTDLYKAGLITKEEFSKSKSILLKTEINEILTNSEDKVEEKKENIITPSLTLGEEDALKAQIFGCWSIPLGLPYNNEDLLVRIKLKLDPDGTVIKAEILDHERLNMPGQGYYKVLAESALRAVKLCQPLKVPSTGYERWKELQLNFDAREMLEG
jgi:uncharacterized protein YqgQ